MTSESSQKQYSGPLFISLIIHGIIFGFFFLGLQFSTNKAPVVSQSVNIVKAVAVNETQVDQEIAKLEQQKRKEQEEKLAQKEEMQQKLEAFKQQQKQEQAKLEKLKQNLKQQQEKQLAEQKAQEKKLADLKEQQAKEAEHLTKLKEQQQAQAQKIKEQQKLAEQKALEKEKTKTAEKPKQPEKLAEKSSTKTKSKKALDDIQKDIQKEDAEKEAASSKKKSLKDLAQNQKPEKDEIEELVNSAQMQGEIDKYTSLILRSIGQRWRIPENADPSLACKLLIKLRPDGTVIDVKVIESSGDKLLDQSAILAVQKASPLPVPEAKDVFNKFREFKLTVRPESILSSA